MVFARLLRLAPLIISAVATAQPLKITDYRTLITPSSVQVSPDGKRIAFLKTTANFETDKNESVVTVDEIATGAIHSLTKPLADLSSVRWSPDGKKIAFLRKISDKGQIFVVSADGDKPHQITKLERGVQQFAWSPKGHQIAYVTPDANPNAAAIKHHDDTFDMHSDGFLTNSIPVPSHLWLMDADGSSPKRLTHGTWSVLESPAPFVGQPTDPSWSPDGKLIAFIRQTTPDDGITDLARVAVVDVATGTVKQLSDRSTYEYQAAFSPKSSSVAYLRPHGPTPLSVYDVFTTTPEGGNADPAKALDQDATLFAWTADGSGVITYSYDHIGVSLWLQKIGGSARRLDIGRLAPSEFNVGKNGSIAFVASTAKTPPEIYLLPNSSAAPKQLTYFNEPLRKRTYAKVTELTWQTQDGEKCDGVLTYPLGYQAGKRYPLVVKIHGGPENAATAMYNGFEADLLRQPIAAKGYFVFEPNYRGSDNLGNRHERAIYRDPAEGPAKDVMAGLAKLVTLGLVDQGRISIVGHSYGGFMTTWMIGHFNGWKSAVVADGAVDWNEAYNLSADGNLAWTRDSLGGTPSDPKTAELYHTGSPIIYAGRITTPTLILSGTSDETVPITESFQLYHVLKDHHVPVRFVAFPGAHHTPDDPVKYERFVSLMMEWVLKHDK